jgi:Flp pilus assembly protein TadD
LGRLGARSSAIRQCRLGDAGAVEQAERHAEHALGIEPRTAIAHAVIAMVRVLRGDWLSAESHFETAVSIDATHPMAPCAHASFLLQQLGYPPRALAQLRAVSALAPDNPLMFMNLAMSYCISGQDEEAVRCARLAIGFGYPESAYPLPLVFIHAATRAQRYADAATYALQLLNVSEQDERAAVAVVYPPIPTIPRR